MSWCAPRPGYGGGGQSGANKTVKLTNSVGDKGCDKGGGMALFVPAACMHACMHACKRGEQQPVAAVAYISSTRWPYMRYSIELKLRRRGPAPPIKTIHGRAASCLR